jgi:hypothetical protein
MRVSDGVPASFRADDHGSQPPLSTWRRLSTGPSQRCDAGSSSPTSTTFRVADQRGSPTKLLCCFTPMTMVASTGDGSVACSTTITAMWLDRGSILFRDTTGLANGNRGVEHHRSHPPIPSSGPSDCRRHLDDGRAATWCLTPCSDFAKVSCIRGCRPHVVHMFRTSSPHP